MQAFGNDLALGNMVERNSPLTLPRTARDKHLYVCGATGTGKSKFLESLIRQDILNWRKSKSGLLLLDPHGSLYDSVMAWAAWHGLDRPIIPIDLRRSDSVVSYNLLRQRKADPAVVVDNFVEAMAFVWGQGGTDQTPLFARWASNVVRTLYDNQHTLIEAEQLTDRVGKLARERMAAKLTDTASKQDWAFANTLTPKEFEAQIGSTVNRLQRFIRNETMRAMFGQTDGSLDLRKALDDGAIILVSLATERARVSKENAELFATLLLSDLWTAAQERGKSENVKPFYIYIDEFQRFVTPTIAENLDEARGYGIHCTLAHQFPNQLLDRGPDGKRIYNSVMENASSKVVFRLSHDENLIPLAKWLFMGVMNPDEIKHQLFSTKVMGYREEYRHIYGESESEATGQGRSSASSSNQGTAGLMDENPFLGSDPLESDPLRWSDASVESEGKSHSRSQGKARSKSTGSVLIPEFGKELSHVQFRSLDEQLFRAMATLFDQKQRQGVARLVEMSAPVSMFTPTINPVPKSAERIERYTQKLLAKLDFALPIAEAQKRIANREQSIAAAIAGEPVSAKRRLKCS